METRRGRDSAEATITDSTIVRAYSCAAVQKNVKQALGRSRGGFSSKIYMTVDGLSNPLRFRLSPGQAHDITQSASLLEGFAFDRITADRSYAAQPFVDSLLKRRMKVVIPPHQRAKEQREYDRHWYRGRHLVECFINKIKHFRRVFPDVRNLIHLISVFSTLSATLSG